MVLFESVGLEKELAKIGAMQLLEEGKPNQAAELTYRWVLKETPRPEPEHDTLSLYDMLSYLLERGTAFGFSCEARIEKDGVIFTITNNKLQKSRIIPILLELLLAQICEQFCDIESEITHSEKYTIVKIKLP